MENTTFALVWTSCTIHMVRDITKRVRKHRSQKTSK